IMPTTTSPLTPATHGLRVAASFNPFYNWLSFLTRMTSSGRIFDHEQDCAAQRIETDGADHIRVERNVSRPKTGSLEQVHQQIATNTLEHSLPLLMPLGARLAHPGTWKILLDAA